MAQVTVPQNNPFTDAKPWASCAEATLMKLHESVTPLCRMTKKAEVEDIGMHTSAFWGDGGHACKRDPENTSRKMT